MNKQNPECSFTENKHFMTTVPPEKLNHVNVSEQNNSLKGFEKCLTILNSIAQIKL